MNRRKAQPSVLSPLEETSMSVRTFWRIWWPMIRSASVRRRFLFLESVTVNNSRHFLVGPTCEDFVSFVERCFVRVPHEQVLEATIRPKQDLLVNDFVGVLDGEVMNRVYWTERGYGVLESLLRLLLVLIPVAVFFPYDPAFFRVLGLNEHLCIDGVNLGDLLLRIRGVVDTLWDCAHWLQRITACSSW